VGRYVITGASRGIGRAVCDLLAAAGDSVIAVGRSAESLDGVPAAEIVLGDLADLEPLAAQLVNLSRGDGIDGIVHAAGVLSYLAVRESNPDLWRSQYEINVVAVAELTRVLLPAMRARAGTVVFVNSGQGLAAGPNLGPYATTKHALRALGDALRAEEPAIRVSSIFLGRVATDMQRQLRAAAAQEFNEGDYIRPATAAKVIVDVLKLPADAVITDVTLRPVERR
jgi:NADP-dependent 3-hydroxy acid dehydrogenase YdfG